MISPEGIRNKTLRQYPKAVSAWLELTLFGDSQPLAELFPLRLPVNQQLSDVPAEAIEQTIALREHSKEVLGYGYTVCWVERQSRKHGLNRFVDKVEIESWIDLLRLVGKRTEVATLDRVIQTLCVPFPVLRHWVKANWKRLLEVADDVTDLVKVLEYLNEHPRPACYVRELPLMISTKLVETHLLTLAQWLDMTLPADAIDFGYSVKQFERRYGFRYPREHFLVRVLDNDLLARCSLPCEELSLPIDAINQLPLAEVTIVLVENKINLLTLPHLKNGIAMGGLGDGVTRLMECKWLGRCKLLYWGDMDVEGFEILSAMRERLGNVTSLMMDEQTLNQWSALAIPGNGHLPKVPTHLTAGESAAFEICCSKNLRIEQERIPQGFVGRYFLEQISSNV